MAAETGFTGLPYELLEEILVLCDPVDVAMVSMTCRRMYGIVYGEGKGKRFWRTLYLSQPLDDLRKCVNRIGEARLWSVSGDDDDDGIDWEEELKRVVRAQSVVANPQVCRGEEELKEVFKTFLGLVEWVPSVDSKEGGLARNLVWVPVMVKEFMDVIEGGVSTGTAGQFHITKKSYWDQQTIQLHARLHTLYGLTRRDLTKHGRVQSRAYVYDMGKYTAENEYGPLVDGGRFVNWVHLEKIHHVMSMHVVWDSVGALVEEGIFEGSVEYEYMIYPMSMPFTQTMIPRREEGLGIGPVEVPDDDELPEDADWAGIGGDWAVCFCFCDHRELIAYNQSGDIVNRLDTSLFEEENFMEIFRRLEVKLDVTRLANDPEHPGRPIIGFVGTMNQPSSSTMYGCVQLTSDNHLKWQFYSGEIGASAIWSSVGIQIGGIGSSFGVLGSWTTAFHDDEDPVGPFWMQKL